jgi:ABC-type phosphate/phosphonate transport system substrate-binding protein
MTLVLGAVAYDPKVVTIWAGFRSWLRDEGLDLDVVLYSNYERQVVDLVAGRIDAAWNSPLAWVRARRLAAAAGRQVVPAVMRDTDRDLTSVVVVGTGPELTVPQDLKGARLAVGAIDSPQATLLPLELLDRLGVSGDDVEVVRFDVGVGLHGDHIGGERDAARALAAGEVDAACMVDSNHLLFTREGTLPPGTRILAQTAPYDHCNLTVHAEPEPATGRLVELLLSMSYSDPALRPLLDAEGLTRWEPGRDTHYGDLSAAVDLAAFYDHAGAVTAAGYRP